MKGISDILNQLFSSPADKAQLAKSTSPLAPKNGQPNVASFDDILAQLAAEENAAAQADVQTAGNNTPATMDAANGGAAALGNSQTQGPVFGSLTTFSEMDIQVSEHIQVSNAGQLAQAENALVSFASSLSQLINLISNLQASADTSQAQKALVSLAAGAITPGQAKSFLEEVRSLTQGLPESQNPLLLPADQQSALLNQVLQQMIQSQQLLFGTAISPTNNNSIQTVGGASGAALSSVQNSDVFLQMSFLDAQLTQVQQSANQSSQVFINLQTFQMAATFIQVGVNNPATALGVQDQAPIFQPIALPNAQAVLQSLDQALQNQAVTSLANVAPPPPANPEQALTTTDQQNLNQNFRALVQLMAQSGVSQAVLTSALNQQPNTPSLTASQTVAQNLTMDQVLNSLLPPAPVPPPAPSDSGAALTQNNENGSLPQGKIIAEQILAQASVAVGEAESLVIQQNQQFLAPVVPADQFPQPSVQSSTISLVVPNPASVAPSTPIIKSAQGLSNSAVASIPAPGQLIANNSSLQALNEVVARLNAIGPQPSVPTSTSQSAVSTAGLSLGQILESLISMPLVTSENPALAQPQANQNSSNVLFPSGVQNQVQTTAALNIPNLPVNNTAAVGVQQVRVDVTALAQTQLAEVAVNSIETNQLNQTRINQSQNPTPINPGFTQPTLVDPALNVQNESLTPAQTVVSETVIDQVVFAANVNVANAVTPPAATVEAPPPPAITPAETGKSKESSISVTIQDVSNPNPQVNRAKSAENAGLLLVTPPEQPPVVPPTPPAVSTVQNVPASVVTGEAAKVITPIPLALKNADLNAPTTQNLTTVSEVKPVTPEAVNAVALGASPSTDFKVSFNESKTTNNNSTPELLTLVPNVVNLPVTGTDSSAIIANPSHTNVSKSDSVLILNQVTGQITVHAAEARAVSRMSFQLIPESLGRVTVQIALVDQSLSARFIVSNPVVKEALQHHMIELKTALNQSGLQIDQLQVQVQGGGSNLLAQYYQYQQEGFAAGLPGYSPAVTEEANSVENTGVPEVFSTRNSLVDMLV